MSLPTLHSLYIHWPFCSSKCYYCDFVALEQHADYQDAYHAALCREIELKSNKLRPEDRNIKTIFIGGGTPSLYPPEQFTELFTVLRKYYNFNSIEEITIEANPADITEERLDTWLSCGVSRVSCGVQVLDDAALERLNRRQRIYDVKQAIKLLPKYFDNISMDLIVGLPGVSNTTWQETIETVATWPLKHLSLYFLTIHEQTPLYYKIKKGEITPTDDETIVDAYQTTVNHFQQHGFMQYEISNFAQKGYESTHNIAYWNRKPYLGFGIGSSSFNGSKRTINQKNLTTYINELKKDLFSFNFSEILTPEQITMETFMLSLRQRSGMHLHSMLYYIDKAQHNNFLQKLYHLEEAGFIQIHNEQVQLTMRGMIFENEVILKLL